MEVNTEDDVGTNRTTIKKLLEPIISFIMEHKDEKTRASCFQLCIEELFPKIKLTPIEVVGVMSYLAWAIFNEGAHQATVMTKLGIRAVRRD